MFLSGKTTVIFFWWEVLGWGLIIYLLISDSLILSWPGSLCFLIFHSFIYFNSILFFTNLVRLSANKFRYNYITSLPPNLKSEYYISIKNFFEKYQLKQKNDHNLVNAEDWRSAWGCGCGRKSNPMFVWIISWVLSLPSWVSEVISWANVVGAEAQGLPTVPLPWQWLCRHGLASVPLFLGVCSVLLFVLIC